MAVFHRGLKFPILNGFDCFFVESHSQAAEHPDIARTPVRADDQRQRAHTLVLGFACFFRKFRLGCVDGPRSGNTTANVENTSTNTAALTGAEARSLARTYSAAAAASNSATRPGTV